MLLEREEQLAGLTELLEATGSEGGKVVLIRGQAGIGKSALVSEFLTANEAHVNTQVGYCDDLTTPQLLGPFWDMSDDDPTLAAALRDGDRMGVMRSALDLLSRKLRPNVVVIEDTQWAGEATLDVIKYMGRRISRTNGLLVLTFRDSEVDRSHPLRLVIGGLAPSDLRRISLPPLSTASISEMAEGSGLDPSDIAKLTGGNPLFISEVVRWGLEGVPASVRDSVLARAAKLSPKAQMFLDLVSVVPGGADMTMLADLRPGSAPELSECEAAGLLVRNETTAWFSHELLRRAIESELSDASRHPIHKEILGWLVDTESDPLRIVHHAREAGDSDAIRLYAPAAARNAMDVGSYSEAADLFRALEPHLTEDDSSHLADIFEQWAEAEYNADSGRAIELIDRAIAERRAAGEDLQLARDLLFAMELHQRLDESEAATACIAEALGILEPQRGSEEHVYALGRRAWLAMRQGDHDVSLDLADQALLLGAKLKNEAILVEAYNVKGTVNASYGDKEGLRILEDGRRRAEQANDPVGQIRALVNMSLCAYLTDDGRLATDLGRRAINTARRYEHPLGLRLASMVMAETLLNTGDWDEAEELAIEVSAESRVEAPTTAEMVLAQLAVKTGRQDAEDRLQRVLQHAEAVGDIGNQSHLGVALAEFLWVNQLNRPEEMKRLGAIRERFSPVVDHKAPNPLDFRLWMLGHPLVPSEELSGPYRTMAMGRAEEAAIYWEKGGFPFMRGLAYVFGKDSHLVKALAIFEQLGARPFAERTREMMKERGMAVPRGLDYRTKQHPAGLTARQDEVLQLMSEGLTDNEIADRLFVSPRTVHHHVSAVLGKLNASNRTEAVTLAFAQHLIVQHALESI